MNDYKKYKPGFHPNSIKARLNNQFKKGNISSNKGKKMGPLSEQHKKNLSNSLKGRVSPNKDKKLSTLHKNNLKNSWDYSKHVTPEIIEKRRQKLIIKWATDLIWVDKQLRRYKTRQPNKGKKLPIEQVNNLKKVNTGNKYRLGKFHGEKTRELIRKARLNQVMPFKDTKPERMMQIALSLHNIPFEKHKSIFGQPDLFIKPNICIFVDGDYFHANPDRYNANQIMKKSMKAYEIWARDLKVNHELNRLGYQVIRIWESDILKDANNCAENIIKLIQSMRYEPLL